MALNNYIKQTMRFIRDQRIEYVNPEDIIEYVNRARRELALRTKSIRILSPVSGPITVANITNPGSGYVNPIATISSPDFPSQALPNPSGLQATALVTQQQGVITNISITGGGDGYFQPVITITDASGPGTGATATVSVQTIMQTQNNQEVYSFSQVPLNRFPGVGQVFWVNGISIIYAAYRYSFMCYSFSTYQAMIRNYPKQYLYVPSVFGQLGQGTNGSIYAYPVASAPYQMEWDCYCLPQDLTDDLSVEALPGPWTDCVPYFAAHLAFLELQNLNAAQYYLTLYEKMAQQYSDFARSRRVSNRYGRWIWLTPLILPALQAAEHIVRGVI